MPSPNAAGSVTQPDPLASSLPGSGLGKKSVVSMTNAGAVVAVGAGVGGAGAAAAHAAANNVKVSNRVAGRLTARLLEGAGESGSGSLNLTGWVANPEAVP